MVLKYKLFRGISDKELKQYRLKGIPTNTKFTTDIFMARKYGKNVIEVNFNQKNFKESGKSNVFKTLKLSERYFLNIKLVKRFKKLMFLD